MEHSSQMPAPEVLEKGQMFKEDNMDTNNIKWWQALIAGIGFATAEILVILRAMGRRK